ncbi:rux, partial [Drosophila busckii]
TKTFAATPIEVVKQVVASVEAGDVRSLLAEICVFNFLGRNVCSATEVTGWVRTQVTNRFKHQQFESATLCDLRQEVHLKERFGSSFGRQQYRPKLKHELPSSLKLHIDTDDDDDSDEIGAVVDPLALVLKTPPRGGDASSSHVLVQYVMATGVLKACHKADDGGICVGPLIPVELTVGYRNNPLEVCLIVYDKHDRYLGAALKRRGARSHRRHANTDDEAGEDEQPPPRTVRRTLFINEVDLDDDLGLRPIMESHEP